MEKQILEILDTVRPSLQMDGGDVEFISFNETTGEVAVRLQGHCAHCPMSNITLKQGIEATLKEHIPAVKSVKAI